MKSILIVLGILSVMFHPMSGSEAQMLIMAGWDFVIINMGVWFLVAFCVALVFTFGVEYAKYTLKQAGRAKIASVKAKKSTRKTDTALGDLIV